MSGCDCSGGVNQQTFNSYTQPMVSPMSDMGSFGSAEIYNSPSYGMGSARDAYSIDLTGTQPQINYQMPQQQNQPPVRNNGQGQMQMQGQPEVPQMVNNQNNNNNNHNNHNHQNNNHQNNNNNQVKEKIVYVKEDKESSETKCPSTGKVLSKYNIIFIVLLLTGLAWHEVIKYYINRSIKFSNGSHKYFIYYAGIASLALLFFISMHLK